jgi:hypothetical protein
MSRRLTYLCTLTILLAALSVQPLAAQDGDDNATPDDAPATTTYTTSDGSFAFEYPADWARTGDQAGNVILAPSQFILDKPGNALLPGEFQLEVLGPNVAQRLTLLPPGLSPQEYMAGWLEQFPPEIEILQAGEAVTVGTNPAVRAVAVLEPLDWLMLAVAVGEGRVAMIFGFAPRGQVNDAFAAAEPIAASLRFAPPQISRADLAPLTAGNVSNADTLALWGGHSTGVRNLDFSPDGTRLASVDDTSVLLIRDTTTGEIIHTYAAETLISAGPVFLPDGERVLLGGADGQVFVVDPATGEIVQQYEPLSDTVWDVALSPDGRFVAAAGRDLTARVWATEGNGSPTAILTGHRTDVVSVAFAASGEQLVTSSLDGTVRLWNIVTGNELLLLFGTSDAVSSVAINPAGTLIAGGGTDGTVVVWDVASQEIRWQATGEDGAAAAITRIVFAPDGAMIAASVEDGSVRLWEAANGVPVTAFGGPGLMNDVAFSTDARLLAGASQSGDVLVWGVE